MSIKDNDNVVYVVKDWAGNVMDWGTFSSFDDASMALDEHVQGRLLSEGIDMDKTYGLENDYPELESVLEKIMAELSAEYWIDEEINDE